MHAPCACACRQLPQLFRAGGVPVRLESRVVHGREAYHCTVNATHVGEYVKHV